MLSRVLVAVVVFSATTEIVSAATDKVVCYWGTWSVYRWGNGKFTVDDIDPTLCTHIIYSFVGIETSGNVRLLDSYLDVDLQNFDRLNALKQINPNLKTLLAIGGWNEGSESYSAVVADPAKRGNFINSALTLVQTWGFDGFDLDWEYPNQRGGVAADRENYVTLLREFREVWDRNGLLLTAAVAAAAPSVDLSYDVPGLSRYLDIINVMTYDLHGSWDEVTGHNAPLYASSVDVTESQRLLNVDAAIRGWIERGADPQKLALGLGVYGRTFTLASQTNNALGAPISGGGTAGRYTSETGMIGYNEIVEQLNEGGWTVVWNNEQQVPYAYKGNQWIGYDNPESIAIKVAFAKSLNLGGVMIWSVDTDDFRGASGTKFSILRAINDALGNNNVVVPQPQPTSRPEASTAATSQTEASSQTEVTSRPEASTEAEVTSRPEVTSAPEVTTSPTGVCQKNGYVRDPDNCSLYYHCRLINGVYQISSFTCPGGLAFDANLEACIYAVNAQC